MNRSTPLASALLAFASTAIAQQPVPVTLNYNFNGVIHAGEANLPDDPVGFRSISDRALDFSAGIPADPLLDKYTLVAAPGAFDIVHLGNRNTVDNGNWAFDAAADADDIGTQPAWLPVVDQSGPQVSVITPQPIFASTVAAFLYQISNGGGSFDVTFDFGSGGSYTASLAGPDWFTGNYPGTQNVDQANPGTNLSITEGKIDLSQFAGDVVTQITFSNASNPVAGYAILACNFEDAARHVQVGSGCYPIAELAGWHQEFATAVDAEAALDNQTLIYLPNGNGGYTCIVGAGTFRPTTAANPVPLGDDAQVGLFLPAAFNFRGTTPVPVVYLSSNGFLSMASSNGTRVAEQPAFYSSASAAAIAAYGDDLDPNNGLAGTISTEYVSTTGVYYISFEAVPNFPGVAATDGTVTFQYQIELASGIVTIVYGDMVQGTTPQNDNVCIGETVPGATTANPIDVFALGSYETYATQTIADGVVMSADVPAVSTATTGTNVVYSVAGAPDFAPSALPGAKIGLIIGSFAPLTPLPGLDLAFLGAPGCPLHVSTLDAIDAFDLSGNFVFPYPAGLPPQTVLNFQAAMLFDTSDPLYASSTAAANGNTFVQTSNAVVTIISDY